VRGLKLVDGPSWWNSWSGCHKTWAGNIYEAFELSNGGSAGIWSMGIPGVTFRKESIKKWARYMYEAFGCQAGVLPESGPWASGTLPTCELPMPCATHSKTPSDGNTAHRKPGHENGQNAEGQDHIHGICNKSEGGLRRSLYSERRNLLPSCCANTKTEHTCSPTSLLVS
jgi:hypothetical protein